MCFFPFFVRFLTYTYEHFNNNRFTVQQNVHYWSSGSALACSFIWMLVLKEKSKMLCVNKLATN